MCVCRFFLPKKLDIFDFYKSIGFIKIYFKNRLNKEMNREDLQLIQNYTQDSSPFNKSILFFNSNSCGELDFPTNIQNSQFDKKYFRDSIKLKSIILRYKNDTAEEKSTKVWFLNPAKTYRVGGYPRKFANSMCKSGGDIKIKTVDKYDKDDIYLLGSFQSTFTDKKSIKYGTNFWKKTSDSDCCVTELTLNYCTPGIYIPELLKQPVTTLTELYPWQKELLLPYGLTIKVTESNPDHKEPFVDEERLRGAVTLDSLEEKKLPTKDMKIRKTTGVVRGMFCNLFNKTFDIFENAIKTYYPYKCHHDKVHAMSTFVLSLILLNLYNSKSKKDIILSSEDIKVLQFVTIFHDSGRHYEDEEKCVDGVDTLITIKRSADKAKKFITQNDKENVANRVYNIILHEKEDQKLNEVDNLIYTIYKGADSIDIGRVAVYQSAMNPFYNRFPELKTDLNIISKEWLNFYRSNILNKLNEDLPPPPDVDFYDSETIASILIKMNENFITYCDKTFVFSYIDGITDICNNLINEDLLGNAATFIIKKYKEEKKEQEQEQEEKKKKKEQEQEEKKKKKEQEEEQEEEKKKIYKTIRNVFSEIFNRYRNPKGSDEYFSDNPDKEVDIDNYVFYINNLMNKKAKVEKKEVTIKEWASSGDEIYEKIFPHFIYEFRDKIPELVKLENIYFKNLDRIAILWSIFQDFKQDFTLSKFIIMLDFFTNWMPLFKCNYSEIRFPYNFSEN